MSYDAVQTANAQRIVNAVKNFPGLPDDDHRMRAADIALATAMVGVAAAASRTGQPGPLHPRCRRLGPRLGRSVPAASRWGGGLDRELGHDRRADEPGHLHGEVPAAADQLRLDELFQRQRSQKVQGSAFPDRYAQRDADAIALRRNISGSSPVPTPPAPPAPPPPPPPPAPSGKTLVGDYTVQPGDNLTCDPAGTPGGHLGNSIAADNNISDPNRIFMGECSRSTPATDRPLSRHRHRHRRRARDLHGVQHGDSLTSIAHKYPQAWVTADSIARLNGISNPNLIYPGQVLRIG